MPTRFRVLIAGAMSASLLLSLLLPGIALGGAVSRERSRGVFIDCSFLTSDDGTLFFGAFLNEGAEPSAGLDAYGPGDDPFEDSPTFTSSGGDRTGSYVGGVFRLEIPVEDGTTGEPAGSAVIEASLVVAGRAEHSNDRFGNGNQQNRDAGTIQPMSIAAGTATLPDGSAFELVDGPCTASEFDVRFWTNDPTSLVETFEATGASCDLKDETGAIGIVFIDVDDQRTTAFVDIFVDPGLNAAADVPIVEGNLSTTLDYVDLDTDEPAGTGAIDVTIATIGQRAAWTLSSATSTVRVRGVFYEVTGTITAPGHDPIELDRCFVDDATIKEIDTQPGGPKPTGAPPANDLPSGALAVSVGSRVNQQTKSAALAEEVPTCITEGDSDVPLPILRTVWYSLAGTGSTVTIDTAGSGFDTVVAVYTRAGDGSFVPVDDACNDDVLFEPIGRSRQAAVTFEAAAGTTYFIQVGGFPDDENWGRLRLAVG